MGGLLSSFPCSMLFKFVGSSKVLCQWKDYSKVLVTLNTESRVTIDDGIMLLPSNGIKAICRGGSNAIQKCSTWNSTLSANVTVTPPDDPLTPYVTLTAPNIVDICDSISIDVSASLGSGGRPWKSVKFYVYNRQVSSSLLSS